MAHFSPASQLLNLFHVEHGEKYTFRNVKTVFPSDSDSKARDNSQSGNMMDHHKLE